MALIECERCGRTKPPLKYIKKWLHAQKIALFLQRSTRTLMACQKKEKKNLKKASVIDDILHTIYYYNSKGRPPFFLENTMMFGGTLEDLRWI